MKRLIGLLLALSSFATQAGDASKAPSYGAHGMAVFGGSGGVFASHLAMFHAPHDYQVLLQIQLADPALEGALRAQLQAEPKLWSIDPEKFPLTDLWQAKQPRKQFRADLYQGHFERGGKLFHKQVLIEVRQVLLHQQLDPNVGAKTQATYRLLQAGDSAFLVKRLQMRPDFDHIVRLEGADLLPGQGELALAIRGISQPADSELSDALRTAGWRAEVGATVYFDTADLR